MVVRAILLAALSAFLFDGFVCADDAQQLPSQKASIVMPLLRNFSPARPPWRKTVLPQIEKILGFKHSFSKAQGIEGFYEDYLYVLDDGTHIEILFWGERFEGIIAVSPNGKREAIYPKPAT